MSHADSSYYFNNKLSLLKSATTLIIPFFLENGNVGNIEAQSEQQFSSRTPKTTNLTISLLCCNDSSTDLGAV
jgi:hypothetical protein